VTIWKPTLITGIRRTEVRALAGRGDACREYQRATSAFFLWPPKASASA
jgi:hypothetical protein